MVNESLVTCPKCGRNVVPRLWHIRAPMSYLKTQHLCPVCGVCMYTTGGQITPAAKMFFLFVCVILPVVMMALAFLSEPWQAASRREYEERQAVLRRPVKAKNGEMVDLSLYTLYSGSYRLPDFYMYVSRNENRLYADGDGNPVELVPLTPEEFSAADGTIRFVRDRRGKVTHAIITRASGEQVSGEKNL